MPVIAMENILDKVKQPSAPLVPLEAAPLSQDETAVLVEHLSQEPTFRGVWTTARQVDENRRFQGGLLLCPCAALASPSPREVA